MNRDIHNKVVYPIVISQGKEMLIVFVPDFDINTQGADFAECMEMARDAIGITALSMLEAGETLPASSRGRDIEKGPDDIVTLVDVDLTAYMRKHSSKAVKKTLSIPAWLNEVAESEHVNFSGLLQSALKEHLNIND